MNLPKHSVSAPCRHVALLVESSSHCGRLMLRGVAEYVRQMHHWSLYYEPAHVQGTLPDWLENWRGDGIIARVRNRKLAAQLAKTKLPVVDTLGDVAGLGIPLVKVNDHSIAELAANHLIEHGFREFGFCGTRGRNWSKRRGDVFRELLACSGYACSSYQLPSFYGRTWFNEAERQRLAQWVNSLPKPIGIMAANDWAGEKVLEACRQIGVQVPEEVAVIGVDNDPVVCEIADPMLSSVNPYHDRVGFRAAELLDKLMQGKRPPDEPLTVGAPSVVVRHSTDVQTMDDPDVVAAVRYIRENACRGVRVEEVAAHVALSCSTLRRRFHHALSRSVYDEIMRVRLARARELLTETEMPLLQIAQEIGYEHQEYFGAIFKSHTGMTPIQFRQANQSRIPR